jgi:hypothetical protein
MCRALFLVPVCRLFCFLLLRSPPYVMGVVVVAAVGYRRCVSHAVQAAVGKAASRQRETRAVMVD